MTTTSFFNNEQADLALQYIQYTDRNLFLTGRAGTGKTTFLKRLKEILPKRMIVVAPTGVAAINAGGVTIHSFFSLPFAPFIPKEARINEDNERQYRFSKVKIDIIRSLDLLVIDEISMVRADVLDAIDEVLRRYRNRNKPFGGVQLLMIGDLQQLPPVVTDADAEILDRYYPTNFFYGSQSLAKTNFVTIELQHIYRQNEARFIELLNAVRDNHLTPELNELLKQRTIPGFESDDYIKLTTHNHQAQRVNDQRLKDLKNASWYFKATVTGDFPESSYPTDFELELKPGARVMFLKNDPSPDKAYFNGKIGVITSIDEDTIYVQGDGEERTIAVKPMEWSNMQYSVDDNTQEIVENVIGTFEQYPLKLAWAITIHKSQGLTFEKVIIDAKAAFAHGQVYVALSRCRSLGGLILSSPVHQLSLITNSEILKFSVAQKNNAPTQESLYLAQQNYARELLLDLFDFSPLQKSVIDIIYKLRDNEQVVSGNIFSDIRTLKDFINQDIVEIGIKFHSQVNELVNHNANLEENSLLQERIEKAAYFFSDKIAAVISRLEALEFETDNRTVKKSITDALEKLSERVLLKKVALNICKQGFNLSQYLDVRAKAILAVDKTRNQNSSTTNTSLKSSAHPELVLKLRAWRNAAASEHNVQPYEILRQKSMDDLIALLPTDKKKLKEVKGLGAKRIREFGEDLLDIVREYMQEKGLQIAPKEDSGSEKINTFDQTYSLYTSGLSVAEIATKRGMAIGTIEGHLARLVQDGRLDIEKLVSEDKVRKAVAYFQTTGNSGLSVAYESLHGELDYNELRLVLGYMKRIESET